MLSLHPGHLGFSNGFAKNEEKRFCWDLYLSSGKMKEVTKFIQVQEENKLK